MREFDSAGLRSLRTVLQTSEGPPQIVELQDEIVQQSIDVMPVIRRDLAAGNVDGIFTATILNTHVGSDTIVTDINPYGPLTTFVGNGYPAQIEGELDVWLLQAYAATLTGSGDFGGGVMALLYNALSMGWRNAANSATMRQDLLVFNQETDYAGITHLTDSVSGTTFLNQQGGHTRIGPQQGNVRIRFRTVKSGVGAATYLLHLTLGLFPISLGQDVK